MTSGRSASAPAAISSRRRRMTSPRRSSASWLECPASSGIPNSPTVRAIERSRCSCQKARSSSGAPSNRRPTPNTSGRANSCGEVTAAPLAQPGQQLPAQLPDVVLHGAGSPAARTTGRTTLRSTRVVRLVQRDQVARAVGVVGAVHVVAQRVDHLLVVAQARLHVLVARHHPQVTTRVVVDRRLVAQLPVHLVGVVVGRVGQRVVEHRQPARLPGGGRQGRRGGEGHRRPHNQRFRPASSQLVADGQRLRMCGALH